MADKSGCGKQMEGSPAANCVQETNRKWQAVSLLPQSFRQRQAGKIILSEPNVGLDTETFEYRNQLAGVLRRMPGRALEKLMHRRSAVKSLDASMAGTIVQIVPPFFQSRDDSISIGDDLGAARAGAVGRRDVGVLAPVFDVVDGGFEKRRGNAKDMMAHQPDRAIAIVDHSLGETSVGDLPEIALRRAQDDQPFAVQLSRRQRRMTAALHADKLGDVLGGLTGNIFAAFGEHRHRARAQRAQLLPATGIIEHVDGDEVNFLARKKLFRS